MERQEDIITRTRRRLLAADLAITAMEQNPHIMGGKPGEAFLKGLTVGEPAAERFFSRVEALQPGEVLPITHSEGDIEIHVPYTKPGLREEF